MAEFDEFEMHRFQDENAWIEMLQEPRAQYNFVDNLPAVKNYRDLIAWQRSMDLVVCVYGLTRAWPRQETGGLTNQIRRAAVSVPSNIAEGEGRRSDAELANRVRIAHGSLREVETQLLIAQRLGFGDNQEIIQALSLADQTGQLLQGLLRSIAKRKT